MIDSCFPSVSAVMFLSLNVQYVSRSMYTMSFSHNLLHSQDNHSLLSAHWAHFSGVKFRYWKTVHLIPTGSLHFNSSLPPHFHLTGFSFHILTMLILSLSILCFSWVFMFRPALAECSIAILPSFFSTSSLLNSCMGSFFCTLQFIDNLYSTLINCSNYCICCCAAALVVVDKVCGRWW